MIQTDPFYVIPSKKDESGRNAAMAPVPVVKQKNESDRLGPHEPAEKWVRRNRPHDSLD